MVKTVGHEITMVKQEAREEKEEKGGLLFPFLWSFQFSLLSHQNGCGGNIGNIAQEWFERATNHMTLTNMFPLYSPRSRSLPKTAILSSTNIRAGSIGKKGTSNIIVVSMWVEVWKH